MPGLRGMRFSQSRKRTSPKERATVGSSTCVPVTSARKPQAMKRISKAPLCRTELVCALAPPSLTYIAASPGGFNAASAFCTQARYDVPKVPTRPLHQD